MSTPRTLIAVSNAEFRSKLVSSLTAGSLPTDAVDGSAAASALVSVTRYSHFIIEVSPGDAVALRLLTDITFQPDPPQLLLVAINASADFLKRLKVFSPALIVERLDDAAVRAITRVCMSEMTEQDRSCSANICDELDLPAPTTSSPAPVESTSKAVVAVRLADDRRAGEVVALLQAAGIAAELTRTGDELYAMLNRERIDLLVIDERLPGFLSGLDVLEMLQRDLLKPDVILLSHVPPSLSERIKGLLPNRVLSPSASTAAIADAAETLLQQRRSLVSFIPQSARQIVGNHSDLRPLPQLLVKLTQYLSGDETDIPVKSVAQDIQSDPRATADLLRFTNSSAHGLRRRVSSVAEALTLLGPRKAIVLILAQSAAKTSEALVSGWSEPLRTWFFRRSVLTAGVAQAFAKIEGVSSETAFLMGLVQDLGIAVTADAFGERYARLIDRVQHVPQLTLATVEGREFGHTHADVSAALLQKWEMPSSLIDPVLAHHGTRVSLSKVGQGFVHVMQIGEAVADLADCCCLQRNNRLNGLFSTYSERQHENCSAAVTDGITRAVEATALLRLPIPSPSSMHKIAYNLQAVEEGELIASV